MRKLINPGANGGAPIYLGDIVSLTQDEQWDVIQGIAASLTRELVVNSIIYNSGIIISGLVVSARNDVLQTASYTAGIVYIDGQFLRVPAYSGNYNVSIEKSSATNTNRTFKDGASKAIIREYKGNIVLFAGSTAAVYMHPDYIEDYRLISHVHGRGQWQTLTLINSWTTAAGRRPAQFRLGRDKRVCFRGAINQTGASSDNFATLPNADINFRPNLPIELLAHAYGSAAEPLTINVSTAGVMSALRTTTSDNISLEGLSFDLV